VNKINSAVFPGLQGGPLMHVVAAKAVAFGEALLPEFQDYARQVMANAKILARTLWDRGFGLVSGGTDTHLVLVDLRTKRPTGKPSRRAWSARISPATRMAFPSTRRRQRSHRLSGLVHRREPRADLRSGIRPDRRSHRRRARRARRAPGWQCADRSPGAAARARAMPSISDLRHNFGRWLAWKRQTNRSDHPDRRRGTRLARIRSIAEHDTGRGEHQS
jgi:hypothetical protein